MGLVFASFFYHTKSMKILVTIFCMFLLSSTLTAQTPAPKKRDSLASVLQRQIDEERKSRLKSYYDDEETAQLCENWNSCAHWAFDNYCKDQSFKITHVKLHTAYRVNRHSAGKRTTLQVEAKRHDQIIRVIFLTPTYTRGKPAFRYVKKFPTR